MEEIKTFSPEGQSNIEHSKQPKPGNNSFKKILIGFLAFFIVAGLVYGGYYLGANSKDSYKTTPPVYVSPSPISIYDGTSNWKTYTDPKNTYSFKYPETTLSYSGGCSKDAYGYYRPEKKALPLRIFEDDNTYLAVAYYYELTGLKEVDGALYPTQCNKIDNSLELLRNKDSTSGHKIISQKAQDDSKINLFIKKNLGNCSFESKKQIREDIYEINIAGSSCFSTGYKFLYDLKSLNIVSFTVGQDCIMFGEENGKEICYSDQILSSFKFTDQNVNISVSPIKGTYPVPSNWKKWTTSEASLYLPPEWILKQDGFYYHRDDSFEPYRGVLGTEKFQGGSRRNQYIAKYNDYGECEPQLTNNTSVTEEFVNGLSVLKIVPKSYQVCHVVPALVFVKDGILYYLRISKQEGGTSYFWNDEDFMDPYYRIVASVLK